jgi:hypothetical protein
MEKNEIKLDFANSKIEIMQEDGTIKEYTQNDSSEYVKDTGRAEDIKVLNWPSDFPSKHDKPEDYEPTE